MIGIINPQFEVLDFLPRQWYDEIVLLIHHILMTKTKNPHTKLRISVTIIPSVNDMLEMLSERTGLSKSALVEKALKDLLNKQLEDDAKILAKLDAEDLPTEDEWLMIQPPLPEYDA